MHSNQQGPDWDWRNTVPQGTGMCKRDQHLILSVDEGLLLPFSPRVLPGWGHPLWVTEGSLGHLWSPCMHWSTWYVDGVRPLAGVRALPSQGLFPICCPENKAWCAWSSSPRRRYIEAQGWLASGQLTVQIRRPSASSNQPLRPSVSNSCILGILFGFMSSPNLGIPQLITNNSSWKPYEVATFIAILSMRKLRHGN